MIIFLGDLHGEFHLLPMLLKNVPKDATIIQVGDFGLYPDRKELWDTAWDELQLENPILFIDGNHEYHPLFKGIDAPTEIWKGAKFIPRGTIMTLENKIFGFLGGASSVDYKYRTLGVSWFLEENVTGEQARPLKDAPRLDILVTHTPPRSVVSSHFKHPIFMGWDVSPDWTCPSAQIVQEVWDYHNQKPEIYCGHFHQSLQTGPVRILDINEVYEYRGIDGDD